MSNLDVNSNITIDVSTPFCPKTYYAALRGLGADPLVRKNPDGGLFEQRTVGANNGVGDVGDLHIWAMKGDPDQSLCRDYAISAWENRAEGGDVVLLGY